MNGLIHTLLVSLALTAGSATAAASDMLPFTPDVGHKAGKLITIPDAPVINGDDATIDLLVVFTPRVAAHFGGVAAFQAYAGATYREVNQFFANTALRTRVRPVAYLPWEQARGSDIGQDLDELIDYLEGQTSLRDDFAADLVQLWEVPEAGVDNPALCGLGQVMGPERRISSQGFGYSVVLKGAPDNAFNGCFETAGPTQFAILAAHEIGHNLGSTHARGDDNSSDGVFNFSFGARCGSNTGTIMSLARQHRPHFSSPTLRYNGTVCQDTKLGEVPADNRETFRRTVKAVASLRGQVSAALTEAVPTRSGDTGPTEAAPQDAGGTLNWVGLVGLLLAWRRRLRQPRRTTEAAA